MPMLGCAHAWVGEGHSAFSCPTKIRGWKILLGNLRPVAAQRCPPCWKWFWAHCGCVFRLWSPLCALLAIVYQKEREEAVPKTCWAINNDFSVPARSHSVTEHRQLLTEGWIVQQQQTPGLSVSFGNGLITCTGTLMCDIKDYWYCQACILTVSLLWAGFASWRK